MKTVVLLALLSVLAIQAPRPVDTMIERLATCQDSWRDWKNDPVQTRKMAELFNTAFAEPA
jgi:hypothetical protein